MCTSSRSPPGAYIVASGRFVDCGHRAQWDGSSCSSWGNCNCGFWVCCGLAVSLRRRQPHALSYSISPLMPLLGRVDFQSFGRNGEHSVAGSAAIRSDDLVLTKSSLGDLLLCLRLRARRRGAGRSGLRLRFGFRLLFLLRSGLCAGGSWRRTRILLGLSIRRRQQRGGAYRGAMRLSWYR